MPRLIVACAQCGKRFKGDPGRQKYRCTRCGTRFTFPDEPIQPPQGKVLCSFCWQALPAAADLASCHHCGERVSPKFGGVAESKDPPPDTAMNALDGVARTAEELKKRLVKQKRREKKLKSVLRATKDALEGAQNQIDSLRNTTIHGPLPDGRLREEVEHLKQERERLDTQRLELQDYVKALEAQLKKLQDGSDEKPRKPEPEPSLMMSKSEMYERSAAEARPKPKSDDLHSEREKLKRRLAELEQQLTLVGQPAPTQATPATQYDPEIDETRHLTDSKAPTAFGRAPGKGTQAQLQAAPPPPALALVALKHYHLREGRYNATILVAVDLHDRPFAKVRKTFEDTGFKTLPEYDNQETHQRAILQYVATVLDVSPTQLCCGAKNVTLDGAEQRVGRISKLGLPLDDGHFEPHVADLRSIIRNTYSDLKLRFVSLPPLDLIRLALPLREEKPYYEPRAEPGPTEIDADWLRARCRDLHFVKWLARGWPDGGKVEEIERKIEYADWLMQLLSYTRYPPYTTEGKRMLVKLACLCAVRAQRWAPDAGARAALAAAERWVEEPSSEHAHAAQKASNDAQAPNPDEPAPSGPAAYIKQAATEAAGHAARAAAAAVMTASFAAQAPQSSSWLELVSDKIHTSEAEEHRDLCGAMRALAK